MCIWINNIVEPPNKAEVKQGVIRKICSILRLNSSVLFSWLSINKFLDRISIDTRIVNL